MKSVGQKEPVLEVLVRVDTGLHTQAKVRKGEFQHHRREAHTHTHAEARIAEGKALAIRRLLISPGSPRGSVSMWTND